MNPTEQAPRVLMVTHYFGSHRGGIELVAQRLAEELLALGQPLTWAASDASPAATLTAGRTVPLSACNVVEDKTGLPFPIPYPGAWIRLFREVRGADVVLLHDCLYLTNLAAFVAARLRSIPVVIVQHIGLVPYRNRVLRNVMSLANLLVTKPMLRRADRVVFISELTRRYFARVRFAHPPATIFNGVDADVFHPPADSASRELAREKLGLPRRGAIAVFAGRFVEKKGVPVVREIAAKRPEVQFALAGRGPIDPAGWKLPNVRVFSDLSGPTLADLYRAADVLVLPSTGEGFPLVVQEALACGLRVLCADDTATADPAARALLNSARVVPGDDAATAEGFVSQLDAVLAQPLAAQDRLARSDFAKQRYSWTAAAAAYRDVFMKLHAAKGEGSAP